MMFPIYIEVQTVFIPLEDTFLENLYIQVSQTGMKWKKLLNFARIVGYIIDIFIVNPLMYGNSSTQAKYL